MRAEEQLKAVKEMTMEEFQRFAKVITRLYDDEIAKKDDEEDIKLKQ